MRVEIQVSGDLASSKIRGGERHGLELASAYAAAVEQVLLRVSSREP